MVSSFRVSELQVLLGFAGRNKSGRKHDLLMRALHLLKSGCSPAVQIKIRELYRRRYPRTLEGLSDLSAIKSPVFSLDGGSSPVEPDLAVAGIHALPSTSVTPHSPSSPVGSVLLQDTKPAFEMQQPSPPVPPVHQVCSRPAKDKCYSLCMTVFPRVSFPHLIQDFSKMPLSQSELSWYPIFKMTIPFSTLPTLFLILFCTIIQYILLACLFYLLCVSRVVPHPQKINSFMTNNYECSAHW